jgi:hypothetical protein
LDSDCTASELTIRTDFMSDISTVENVSEVLQTAYGLYSELLNLAKDIE